METGLLVFASLLLAGLFTGCAVHPPVAEHEGGRPMAHDHGAMDMQSMCAMHRQMFEGRTAAERQAFIDEHMKSMTPQMREQMRTMLRQCGEAAASR